MLTKRSWDLAFEVPMITYQTSMQEQRPVVRALFPSLEITYIEEIQSEITPVSVDISDQE